MPIDNSIQKCKVQMTEAKDRISIREGNFQKAGKESSEGSINAKSYWSGKQAKSKKYMFAVSQRRLKRVNHSEFT